MKFRLQVEAKSQLFIWYCIVENTNIYDSIKTFYAELYIRRIYMYIVWSVLQNTIIIFFYDIDLNKRAYAKL